MATKTPIEMLKPTPQSFVLEAIHQTWCQTLLSLHQLKPRPVLWVEGLNPGSLNSSPSGWGPKTSGFEHGYAPKMQVRPKVWGNDEQCVAHHLHEVTQAHLSDRTIELTLTRFLILDSWFLISVSALILGTTYLVPSTPFPVILHSPLTRETKPRCIGPKAAPSSIQVLHRYVLGNVKLMLISWHCLNW